MDLADPGPRDEIAGLAAGYGLPPLECPAPVREEAIAASNAVSVMQLVTVTGVRDRQDLPGPAAALERQ
jgi:hypothetical protein